MKDFCTKNSQIKWPQKICLNFQVATWISLRLVNIGSQNFFFLHYFFSKHALQHQIKLVSAIPQSSLTLPVFLLQNNDIVQLLTLRIQLYKSNELSQYFKFLQKYKLGYKNYCISPVSLWNFLTLIPIVNFSSSSTYSHHR